MFLHKLLLDMRCKEVRRDVADPYEMHSTLCRAFASSDYLTGFFLWRLEPEFVDDGRIAKVLVQSCLMPNWRRINLQKWFADKPSVPINIYDVLRLNELQTGRKYRFRLRANPSVYRNGKRAGLYLPEKQDEWLCRQGERCGFTLQSSYKSEEHIIIGKKRTGQEIKIFSLLFGGLLVVKEPSNFTNALLQGIGHGKALGLGLLSIVPV